MTRPTTVEVECRCGARLFKYRKSGAGRLIKCFLSRILIDYAGVPAGIKTGENVHCPACRERVGTIQMIHGQPAVKLNQGQIKPIRIG